MAKTDIQMTLYEALGCTEDATTEQLKKAYKRLAQKYHPDRVVPTDDGWVDPWPKRVLQIASSAANILTDETKRAGYDRWLADMRAGMQKTAPEPVVKPSPGPPPQTTSPLDGLFSALVDPNKVIDTAAQGMKKWLHKRKK